MGWNIARQASSVCQLSTASSKTWERAFISLLEWITEKGEDKTEGVWVIFSTLSAYFKRPQATFSAFSTHSITFLLQSGNIAHEHIRYGTYMQIWLYINEGICKFLDNTKIIIQASQKKSLRRSSALLALLSISSNLKRKKKLQKVRSRHNNRQESYHFWHGK